MSIALTPLDQDEFVLAVSDNSPLAQRDAIALSEAAHEPFVMYPQDTIPSLAALAKLRCQQSGFTRIAQEAMQVQTIMSLVASGWAWVWSRAFPHLSSAARREVFAAAGQSSRLSCGHCAGAFAHAGQPGSADAH
jgi:DNA-binding transcriptional LysR family regulator